MKDKGNTSKVHFILLSFYLICCYFFIRDAPWCALFTKVDRFMAYMQFWIREEDQHKTFRARTVPGGLSLYAVTSSAWAPTPSGRGGQHGTGHGMSSVLMRNMHNTITV
jgi:hypothetical protein